MFRKWALIVVFCVSVLGTGFPGLLFAQAVDDQAGQPTCSCWCSSSAGAKGLGTKTATSCRQACAEGKMDVLVCSKDPTAWPENDVRCFHQKECEDSIQNHGYGGEWDVDPNPNCPAEYRYCFPKLGTSEIDLGVPIGDVRTVKDLETYLSKGFTWLLSIAVVVTVVMVMVGGLQYSLGGLAKNQMENGKKRIKAGISGLVLLLTSVLIVQTINPQLLKLNVPKLPLVRTVITPNGTSCNEYLEKNYQLSATSGTCGDVSDVLKDAKGAAVSAGSQCVWLSCGNEQDQCVLSSNGATCTSCEKVVEGSGGAGLKPSEQVCRQFQYPVRMINGLYDYRYCGWTKDSDLNRGIEMKIQRNGSCAFYEVDCTQITSCEDYDTAVIAKNKNSSQPLEDIIYEESALCGLGGCGNFGLQSVCEANPCGIARGCTYDYKAWLKYDCIPAK